MEIYNLTVSFIKMILKVASPIIARENLFDNYFLGSFNFLLLPRDFPL